jgi:predicted HTH domain antitoxin
MTNKVVLDFDVSAMAALRKGPAEFAEEVKVAAVVQWYAEGMLSQSKAAEILGISRQAFLSELFHRKVPALQYEMGEVQRELGDVR